MICLKSFVIQHFYTAAKEMSLMDGWDNCFVALSLSASPEHLLIGKVTTANFPVIRIVGRLGNNLRIELEGET